MSQMICSCCAGWAGAFKQHSNRDSGYGICRSCVDWLLARGTSPEEIKRNYGVSGVHYEPKLFKHMGRAFKVLAEFVDSPEGQVLANKYMTSTPNSAVLCVSDGVVVLADLSDHGQPA
jgi:hypothetical protein